VAGSGKPLVRRALEQPENVKKALNMVRSEGVTKTVATILGKIRVASPTGYSIAGIVLAVGEEITDIQPGDRVAAAGECANHAEYVDVPRNLVMRIPDGLGFEAASTVALGGVAMQGVRRAQVQLGEYVVVFGAGLIGQLIIQMSKLSGGRILAVDLDEKRLQLAKELAAEAVFQPNEADSVSEVLHYTGRNGADVVFFCAATTDSRALSDAFAMTRKKGRVVVVGVWGGELRREDIYEKELDFFISTSYGPGRYDEGYEKRGLDYPYGYVRWTENRNMEEYLRLLASGRIQVEPLIQAVYPLDQVEQAFKILQSPDRPLMVLLDYGADLHNEFSILTDAPRKVENKLTYKKVSGRRIQVGLIGAGAFAVSTHLPNLERLKDKYKIRAICNRTGSKAQSIAQQFKAKYATTDYKEMLSDPDIDLVMICTRHNLHGQLVLESLLAGKHTFVEKPLCTALEELCAIKKFYDSQSAMPLLMVGFNRRFSQYALEVKKHVQGRINPLFINYRMNAGYMPLNHWVHGEEGGGRVVGEACHIIDLFSFLVDAPVRTVGASSLRPATESASSSDNKSIVLEYEDGSVATLHYYAVGSKELPKERLEVHFDEKTIVVDDYRSIKGYGIKVSDIKTTFSDKGLVEELEELARCLSGKGNGWPIALEDILETTQITFEIA
jgi:predicted dehydrogenase/threonine dehydrogenase-like Zn-dependent dehydrogenase